MKLTDEQIASIESALKMDTVKLYVHKYLGCLCLYTLMPWGFLYSEDEIDFLHDKKEDLLSSPDCWELLDSWEEPT